MNTETTCATNELALADLKAADIVRIETLNSVYEFTNGDPATRCGTVCGGSFGKRVVDAVLVCENLRLKVGTKARLFVVAALRYGFTTTSIITGLTHIKITERDVTTRMVSDGSARARVMMRAFGGGETDATASGDYKFCSNRKGEKEMFSLRKSFVPAIAFLALFVLAPATSYAQKAQPSPTPDREPVFIDLGGLLRNQNYGSCCDSMYESNITYTVPAGKRLVIEQAFMNVRVLAGAKVSGYLRISTATSSGGSYERIPVVFTQQGSDNAGRSIFVANQAVKLYINPEAGMTKKVSVLVLPQSTDNSSGADSLYISGYLEDVPQRPTDAAPLMPAAGAVTRHSLDLNFID